MLLPGPAACNQWYIQGGLRQLKGAPFPSTDKLVSLAVKRNTVSGAFLQQVLSLGFLHDQQEAQSWLSTQSVYITRCAQ